MEFRVVVSLHFVEHVPTGPSVAIAPTAFAVFARYVPRIEAAARAVSVIPPVIPFTILLKLVRFLLAYSVAYSSGL